MSEHALESAVVRWFSRWSLFHWLALLVAAPLLLLGVAAVTNAQREYAAAERSALEDALALARQAAARADEHYDELDQFLTAVAEVARETLLRGVDGDPALTRMIHATPQHVTGLSILSLDGRMLASTTAAPEMRSTVNVADRPYFTEAVKQRRTVVGEPVYSRTTDLWVSISARPVFDDGGRPIGAVSTSSRLDRIQTILVPAGLPLGALMTVFNDRGIGIASTAEPRAALGRDFSSLETVRRVLRERELNAKALASDGRERLLAYAAGEKLPWIVEVGLPVEQALAPARQQLRERLSLLAVALILGLAAAAWFARRIGQPISDLARDADELGKGNLTRRSQARGYREVTQLGAALNAMAGTVDAKQSELKASEERFRSLVMLSSDWYWTQDTEHRFTSHTAGRFGEIGLDAADFSGKARWEMSGAEPVGTTWAEHRALLEARKPWRDLVVRYADQNGETQYMMSSGEPTFGANGDFTGYRGVARLVSERFRLEAERAKAEAAVRESDAKFRALTALSSDWYWEQDANFRFTAVGSDDPNWALPMIGKTRLELNGEPLVGDWAEHQALLERHETFRDVEFRYTGAHGLTAYLSVSGEPVYDVAGVFIGYRGTATDVTERFHLQHELQERMELLRVTLDTAPVAIAVVRTHDNLALMANRAAHELLRIDPAKHDWSVLEHWERIDDARELKRRLERDGYVRDLEAPIRTAQDQRLWALVSAQPARYRGEEVTVATLNDITASKALEGERESLLADLRAANQRLSRLSRQLLDAQESERRQIAHELHDEIGQNLSALKLFAGHFRTRFAADTQFDFEEWVAVLDRTIEQVRDLSRLLRPVQLDHMGLAPALRALLDTQARAAGWCVDFAADADLPRIGMRQETVAYRVVQEALTNAARHADAARVSLQVKLADGQLRLTLDDDGRGFDIGAARKRVQEGRSMGLLGMEERVHLAGGTFEIDSAPTRGTRIMVTLPAATEAVQA